MSGFWAWAVLAGLGVYHGVNPAMGWLFAVALGLHRGSRRVVWWSIVPIGLGHAASVALVLAAAVLLGRVVEPHWLARLAGLVLIGWSAWHGWRGSRHKVRVGMRAGFWGLTLWSFVMATAHGAGLMLLPVLLPISGHHAHGDLPLPALAMGGALAGLAVHSAAMLATTLIVAVVVYEWVGVAILRRGWVNFDLLWVAALAVTGVILLVG
jgi:hypothetical protein